MLLQEALGPWMLTYIVITLAFLSLSWGSIFRQASNTLLVPINYEVLIDPLRGTSNLTKSVSRVISRIVPFSAPVLVARM